VVVARAATGALVGDRVGDDGVNGDVVGADILGEAVGESTSENGRSLLVHGRVTDYQSFRRSPTYP
jgi:hypothetical protein